MVDFINEVEEELRKDQYNAMLRKWGPWLVGLAVLIVGATGAYEYLKSSGERASKTTSISYFEAAERAEVQDTNNAKNIYMAIADNAQPGYAGLSLMQAAALSLDTGNSAEAITLYDRAAQTFETDLHKQLATLKAAYLRTDAGQYDDVRQRLTPLAESGQPYEYLARELLGFIALEQGDTDTAKREFSYLARSPDVPTGIQQRSEQVLTLEAARLPVEVPPAPTTIIDAPAPDGPSLDGQQTQMPDTQKDAQP